MSGYILCREPMAAVPYYIENIGINIYSVEELCYCLKENVFLLDQELVSVKLADWLEKECGLQELAKSLNPLVNQKESLPVFVFKILEYTGFYDSHTLNGISQSLQAGASLSEFEKKKKRGDFLVSNHKYTKALLEYKWLLSELPGSETQIRAGVLHNMGTALARLFMFEEAAQRFLESYRLSPEPDCYRDYLAAKRMFYDDQEYIGFVAGLPEAYDVSLKLEREVDLILEEWENGEERKGLAALFSLKEDGHNSLYYEEIDIQVQRLKDRYREYTQF